MQNTYVYIGNFTYVFLLINAVHYGKSCRVESRKSITIMARVAMGFAPALPILRNLITN